MPRVSAHRGLEGSAGSVGGVESSYGRVLTLWHSNVTRWGPQAEGFCARSQHDVLMLSETHLTSSQFEPVGRRMGALGWNAYHSGAVPTGRSDAGNSAGVALFARKFRLTSPLDECALTESAAGQDCQSLRWCASVLRLRGVSVLLCEVYLITGTGMTDDNLNILRQLQVLQSLVNMPLILAGDWNCTPQELAATGWLEECMLVPCVPDVASTCTVGDRVLDFFVISHCLQPLVKAVTADFEVPWKPHCAVRLDIYARPRAVMCRRLVVPKPLPIDSYVAAGGGGLCGRRWAASLHWAGERVKDRVPSVSFASGSVHGFSKGDPTSFFLLHPTLAANPDMMRTSVQLGDQLATLSLAIEHYVCTIAGAPMHGGLGNHCGRGQLPRFEVKPLVRRAFEGSRYSCPSCDYWAIMLTLLARWAKVCVCGPSSHVAALLRTKLGSLHVHWYDGFNHDEMKGTWGTFLASPECVDPAVLDALTDSAQSQRRYYVNRRAAALKSSFKQWLSTSLLSGASAAHRFTKGSSSQVSMSARVDGCVTSDPESVMRAKSEHWSGFWSNPVFPDRLQSVIGHVWSECVESERPQPIDVEKFRAVALAYGSRKSRGSDHWSAKELAALPGELLGKICSLLDECVSSGVWPIQLLTNLMPILGKPSGGERCVAKTPVLYRLWCCYVREEVRVWERANVATWDTAKEGSSALWPALLRGLRAEIAASCGKNFAALLWDLHKFFDMVDPVTLVGKARELGFPLRLLLMAIQMHTAPRVVQLLGACSLPIPVLRSVLPGCGFAIPFTRMYLRDEMEGVHLSVPDVCQAVYVDDISQTSTSTLDVVVDLLVRAGMRLDAAVNRLHLKVSPKSVVVASSPRLAGLIRSELSDYGVTVGFAPHARDLGLCLNPTKRRSTSLQAPRLAAAKVRLGRTAGLVKVNRGARKLVTTGSFPQALWGHVSMGIAPTVVDKIRTQAAAASGICQKGRCRTTAIALAFGQQLDPAVKVAREQTAAWLDLWSCLPELRADIRVSWVNLHARVFRSASPEDDADRPSWNVVTGPMGATMATLSAYGWRVRCPDVWRAPDGEAWVIGPGSCRSALLEAVTQSVTDHLWRTASLFWCGGGLASGLDCTATFVLHRYLTGVRSSPGRLAMLEAFLAGGYWPEERCYHAGVVDSPACRRCGADCGDAFHLIWDCPANGGLPFEEVLDSQSLVGQARAGCLDMPCLWLRGLVPRSLTRVDVPCPHVTEVTFVGSHPPGEWPAGTYWTDGSGGKYGSIRALRRCGSGVAVVRLTPAGDVEFAWGAFAPLAGEKQTVPRSELAACIMVISRVAAGDGPVEIVTDSLLTWEVHSKGPEAFTSSTANGDLWQVFWSHSERLGHDRVKLRWVKAHATVEHLVSGRVSYVDLMGNAAADALADRAAKVAEVCSADASRVLGCVNLANRIQLRAVAILIHVASVSERRPKTDGFGRRANAPIPLNTLALASPHKLIPVGSVWHCSVCLESRHRSLSDFKAWISTECKPTEPLSVCRREASVRHSRVPQGVEVLTGKHVLHSSHELRVFRGLYYCTRCGCYASSAPKRLKSECQGLGKAGRTVLSKIQRGLLPPGLRAWPDELVEQALSRHIDLEP